MLKTSQIEEKTSSVVNQKCSWLWCKSIYNRNTYNIARMNINMCHHTPNNFIFSPIHLRYIIKTYHFFVKGHNSWEWQLHISPRNSSAYVLAKYLEL